MCFNRSGGNAFVHLICLAFHLRFYAWHNGEHLCPHTYGPILRAEIHPGIKLGHTAVLYVFLTLAGRSGREILKLPKRSCREPPFSVGVAISHHRAAAEGLKRSSCREIEHLRGDFTIEGMPRLPNKHSRLTPIEPHPSVPHTQYCKSASRPAKVRLQAGRGCSIAHTRSANVYSQT